MTTNQIFTHYCAQMMTKIATDIFAYISAAISHFAMTTCLALALRAM
jgi:hypothetical protein